MKRGYGWHPSTPDHRDYQYSASISVLPPLVDLRDKMPPVYDQGQAGSCTANAIAGAIEYEQIRQQLPNFVPSRLFIYYNERVMENSIASDSGAMLRDGMKSVATLGVCPETEWPYDLSKMFTNPSADCYKDALLDRVLQYSRVQQNNKQMRGCLAEGFPFVAGFTVYESFESKEVARTGVVPMPTLNEEVVGGHAILVVGFSDHDQRFIVRNSWGSDWGQAGYFTIPYAFLTDQNLASDFWTIRLVEEGTPPPTPPSAVDNCGCFSSFFRVLGKH